MSLLRRFRPSFLKPPSPLCRSPRKPPFRLTSTSSTSKETLHRQRLLRLQSRLPKFLHAYTTPLLTAPISHILSFLILHEITAVVPLIGFATLFHYTQWLPEGWASGKWVSEGTERFGRYFGRKGWFGFSVEGRSEGEEGKVEDEDLGGEDRIESAERRFSVGERGGRILVEVATAYALTKVLLPVRIGLSVWGTPWFARVVVKRVGGWFRRSKA